MTITKPKRKTQEEFINGAPDAGQAVAAAAPTTESESARRRIIRGKKEQLTLTLAPTTVDLVDQAAAALGLSRTAWITQAINLRLQEQSKH